MRFILISTLLYLACAQDPLVRVEPSILTATGGETMNDLEDCPHCKNHTKKMTHYGNPKVGCLKDEQPFRIEGVKGDVCAPR